MNRERGFSLLEFTFVLAVVILIGGIIAGAGAYYAESSRSGELRSHILAVKAGAMALAKRGGQSGLQNHAAVARAGSVPAGQIVPASSIPSSSSPGFAAAIAAAGNDALRHPYGGLTSVRLPGVAAPGGLLVASIDLFGLNTDECIQAVGIGWDSFDRVSVNGAPPFKDRFASPPQLLLDPQQVDVECSSGASNVVTYEFAP